MKGQIKWFDILKGFGYIVNEDGSETYIHAKAITKGRTFTGFKAGDEVEFEVIEGKKGPLASNVVLTKEAEPEKPNNRK